MSVYPLVIFFWKDKGKSSDRFGKEPMPSVLFVIDNLGPGGSQRYVAEMARFAPSFGVTPHVCSFRGGDVFEAGLLQIGVPVLITPFSKLYGPDGLSALMKVVRYIRNHRIDIVHTFQTNPNILGTIAGKICGTKVITSRRDMGDFGMRGSGRLASFETKVINRLANRIMANSQAALDAAVVLEDIPRDKMVLAYNGMDGERFSPPKDRTPLRKALGIEGDRCVFGIVAGHRKVKAVEVALSAFRLVRDVLPDALFLQVGDGPERGYLEAEVRRLGLGDSVRFMGVRPDVERLLPVFDIFLLSSKTESFSNAILEAMAAGLPVIATRVGGNPECVKEGVTGLLVPSGNPEEMAKAMLTLARDPVLRRQMGRLGRERILETFSYQKSRDKLRMIYEDLLSAVP